MNCRCRMIAIMISREEWAERVKARAEGNLEEWKPKNPVTEMPEAFNKWVKDNTGRIEAGRHTPYWIQDNFKGGKLSGGLNDNIPTLAVKTQTGVNPMFKDVNTHMDEELLYRGDIRDKGETFSEATDSKDYVSATGGMKNKAGFHWFTESKEYAKMYATQQMSKSRGEIETPILTTVKTKDLNILDLTKMDLSDEVRFLKSLYDKGIKDVLYKQELLPSLGENESITIADLNKRLGYKLSLPTHGKYLLEHGQNYSDGERGVLFKEWLIENGFDGYRFQEYIYGSEIGLVTTRKFTLIDRVKVTK